VNWLGFAAEEFRRNLGLAAVQNGYFFGINSDVQNIRHRVNKGAVGEGITLGIRDNLVAVLA